MRTSLLHVNFNLVGVFIVGIQLSTQKRSLNESPTQKPNKLKPPKVTSNKGLRGGGIHFVA